MPPKKHKSSDTTRIDRSNSKAQDTTKKVSESASSVPAKRKQENSSRAESEKIARRSGRGKPKPEPSNVLAFLLSQEALDFCRPKDEVKDIKVRGEIKTYSDSELSPFEELLSAVVLSRPISHALGVRTIRTILNDPYGFNSPQAIIDAGSEKVHQSLWDARTQHKEKTADQLSSVAEVIIEQFSDGNPKDTSLEGVRKRAGKDMDEESNLITSNIKGIGKTGMSIFFRRIQWLWEECYPYIDQRTSSALEEFGLPGEAKELEKFLHEHWTDVAKLIPGKHSEGLKKRRAFVVVLERAIGAGLEKNIDDILSKIR